MEELTDGSRTVANRSALKHRQGALLSPEEKEENTLQAIDGKSRLFSKERTFFFFFNFELTLYFFPKAKNLLFFNCRKTALQCCVGFCHIIMRTSHNYIYGGVVNN